MAAKHCFKGHMNLKRFEDPTAARAIREAEQELTDTTEYIVYYMERIAAGVYHDGSIRVVGEFEAKAALHKVSQLETVCACYYERA